MNQQLFHVLLFIHLVSLIIGFGAIIVIDSFGLLWILNLKKVGLRLVTQVANITQRLIWLGFFGLVASGIPMLILKDRIDNLTKIKLFFVAMIGINGLFLHFIKKEMKSLPDAAKLPLLLKFRIALASTISQLGWWGAIIIGFTHGHIQHYIAWPQNWVLPVFIFLALLGVVIIIGEITFRRK